MHGALRTRAGVAARLLTITAIAAGCLAAFAGAAAAASYPVIYNGLIGYGAHALTPDVPAAGSVYVDWRSSAPPAPCHSATHPYPVVLVPGTWLNQADDFAAVSPLLADNGYCVYTTNLGSAAGAILAQTGDIPTSASELATVVGKVLSATGAAKVDLVGHSQGGGLLPRWYMRFDGGAGKVNALVGLAPSNHGTTVDGLQTLADDLGGVGVLGGAFDVLGFPAASQQLVGSQVNATLDAGGGDTVPGVAYTNIVSRNDEVVTPYTNQYLTAGPGATVHNILLQNVCALDQGDHLSVVYDQIALRLMLNALDPSTAKQPACTPVAPVVGG
jgi:triacylglycerol esterase/lipase EstA (alpha/beta hydrolase family)